jgi:plasmid maintenance system antidote protein VapI
MPFAQFFGNLPEFWLNAQQSVDLWDAAQAIEEDIAKIRRLNFA